MKKKLGIGIGVLVVLVCVMVYYFNFRQVTVSFEARVGAGIAPVSVRVGNVIAEPSTPDTDEYKFLGWYLDGEKFDFNTPIKKNITLEAKWEKINNDYLNEQINQDNASDVTNENGTLSNEFSTNINDISSKTPSTNKNETSNKTTSSNEEKDYYYIYQYNAFEIIVCPYEEFYCHEDKETKICYDNKSIGASSKIACPSGYSENIDGTCSKQISLLAMYNKYCAEGELEENDRCYKKNEDNSRAIGICPEGYKYYNGGWGLEKGYCYNADTRERNYDIVSYTCDGVKSIREPQLILTATEAYCIGYTLSWSQYIYDSYCLDGYTLYDPRNSKNYISNNVTCNKTDIKSKEKQYYCPEGYDLEKTLDGYKCSPNKSRNAKYTIKYDCLEGDYGYYERVMIDNKCYDKYEKKY